jgi:aspartate/methionine/tyrosine aminotransferase
MDMMTSLACKGLIVAPGAKFFGEKKEYGWARITFATTDSCIEAALKVLEDYNSSLET